MKLYKSIFILFITWVLLSACAREKPTDEKKLDLIVDRKLTEISADAGVIYTSMHLQKDLNCLDQISIIDSIDGKIGSIELKKIIQNSKRASQNICDLYQKALSETEPVFNEIKQTNSLLQNLYFFSIYLPNHDSGDLTMREEVIGLFSSLEKCERIELLARSYDIPTRKCKQWNERAMNKSSNK